MATKKKPVIGLDTKLKGNVEVILDQLFKSYVKKSCFVEGISAKKNKKPTQNDQEGGIVEIKDSVHISNVIILDDKNDKKGIKIGYKIDKDGKKFVLHEDLKQNYDNKGVTE